MAVDTPKRLPEASCLHCWRPENACICSKIEGIPSNTKLLLLQHPREVRSPVGTARLVSMALPDQTTHRVGLSWGSLSKALRAEADPSRWAVLYLGTRAEQKTLTQPGVPFQVLSPRGVPVAGLNKLQGLVLLDGNWKQAKTLWWRNHWLTRLNRLVLNPTELSKYRKLRRGARAEYLSTIEAAAFCLQLLEANPAPADHLLSVFTRCCLSPEAPATL